MNQGQGLESLIPNKNNQGDNSQNPNQESDSFDNQNNQPSQNNPQPNQPQNPAAPIKPPRYYPPQPDSQNQPQEPQKETTQEEPAPFRIDAEEKPQTQENQFQEASPQQEPPEPERQTQPQEPTTQKPEPEEPEEKQPKEAVFQIEVEKIKPNPFQPRKEYDQDGLNELAQSIREVGIIQPLVVSKIEETDENRTKVHYQLISGERRLRAAKIVGMNTVPAVVKREGDNNAKLSMALIENLQRADLNPIETARGFARLQDEFNLTQREIATRVGKSRESISNTLRLLNLPTKIQEAISKGSVNESQGRILLSVKDPARQEELFQKAKNGNISARRLRTLAKQDKEESGGSQVKSEHKSQKENFWAKQIEERLGIPVSISDKGKEKRLTFKLHNQNEWDKLMKRLIGEE